MDAYRKIERVDSQGGFVRPVMQKALAFRYLLDGTCFFPQKPVHGHGIGFLLVDIFAIDQSSAYGETDMGSAGPNGRIIIPSMFKAASLIVKPIQGCSESGKYGYTIVIFKVHRHGDCLLERSIPGS
jgi:hypothetical protein